MEGTKHSSIYVAPLHIVKSKSDKTTQKFDPSYQQSLAQAKLKDQMTPPPTPLDADSPSIEVDEPSRSTFPNYLRAFYPFQPSTSVSPSTVTLPLNAGNLILVHSIHINGWADGTLLDTGARGWLPTNYCEPYEHIPMRPLLKALTDFWDVIRSGHNATLHVFRNQDYLRGLIAGVRYLLERSDCLTRDSPIVKRHDNIRRVRKALLADLSSLVKIAKNLQDIALGSASDRSAEEMFSEMLPKAFKIVTRGVRFLDVWNEDVGLNRAIESVSEILGRAKTHGHSTPQTPPGDSKEDISKPDIPNTATRSESRLSRDIRNSKIRPTIGHDTSLQPPDIHESSGRDRPTSLCGKRTSISHRMASGGHTTDPTNPNFASERLRISHDTFLGCLGTFLGLHMQSRSSSELLVTTQHSVKSCRQLLAIVEIVLDHDTRRSESLVEAKLAMCDSITELVHAAREVFRPVTSADQEMVFMPDEGKRLVNAARDCVRAAGECVALTRCVLERIGDFEPEPAELQSSILTIGSARSSQRVELANEASNAESEGHVPYSGAQQEPIAPRLDIPETTASPTGPLNSSFDSSSFQSPCTPDTPNTNISEDNSPSCSDASSVRSHRSLETPTNNLGEYDSPRSPDSSSMRSHRSLETPTNNVAENRSPDPVDSSSIRSYRSVETPTNNIPRNDSFASLTSLQSPPTTGIAHVHDHELASCERTAHASTCSLLEESPSVRRSIVQSTDSHSTYVSSVRDSEMSTTSLNSTKATSPGGSSLHLEADGSDDGMSISHSTLPDECDETEAKVMEKTFAHELMYNKEGHVMGGTLSALIEKLTAHHSTPDALFVSTFYLTFRLFASPQEFAEALAYRFQYIGETPRVAGPVRLRVYNVFKGWLESHWRHDCDNVALPFILDFARNSLTSVLPTAGKRLSGLAEKVAAVHSPLVPRLLSSMGKTNTSVAQYVNPETPVPAPIITKSQLAALKTWKMGVTSVSILDFDPLELARQITLKESAIFCSILPEELLATEWMKRSGSLAVNVRAMSTLSTDLANLVADSILQQEEPKKRALVIKQWVKIANKCVELQNYDSLMAIICSLNLSTIIRLKRTWDLVSQKTKATLDELKKIVDVSRNYIVLRQRIQNHVPPCLPFVGIYLTDLTFVDHGNQTSRQLSTEEGSVQVINFDKHMKTAKVISELQRFQIPYRLTEVPELQTWMQDQLVRVRSAGEKSFQNNYRRSLFLEPREQAQAHAHTAPAVPNPPLKSTDKVFDFLIWPHTHKDKSIATNG